MMGLTCLLIAGAMFISSCSSFYTGGLVAETNLPLVVEPRGQHLLGPLSATEIAVLAVENSLELKAEKNSLEARSGAWRLGIRGFFPRLEVSAGSDERLSLYSADSFGKNLSVSVTQPLWDGGRLAATRSLESAAIALARAELERMSRAIGEEAIAASRAVVSAGARLEIKRTSRSSASSQRSILVTEINLGLAMPEDLIEVETSLAEMDLELAVAELELCNAQAELAEALCVDQAPELSEQLVRYKPIMRIEPRFACAMAVERSPELTLARFGLAQKKAEYRASRFTWLPKIGLKVSGVASGSIYPLTRATWSAGLTIDFSGACLSGSGSTQLGGEQAASYTARTNNRLELLPDPAMALGSQQAKLALDLEYEGYSIKLGQVERSVRVALGTYENAILSRTITTRSYELAESKLRLTALKVELGQVVRSELIQAELEKASSEAELVDAIVAMEAAERKLEILFDIPPGSLAAFIDARGGALP